ncbi:tetratricopeptide repeat protein [Streptomyces sp. NPDC092369]|uniref:tetratricopeptide repeat protein n=1 Tax=Streptomyces sp. NPDC092369 TaxID=3366015 RepID=UPI00382B2CD6
MTQGSTWRPQGDEQRPSRGELTERLKGHIGAEGQEVFVGRYAERAVFTDNLSRDPGSDDFHRLFHVHGVGGVGKSALVRHWAATARAHGAPTAVVDGADVRGVVETMKALGAELGLQSGGLKDADAKTPSPDSEALHQAPKDGSARIPGDAVVACAVSPGVIGQVHGWTGATARDQRLRARGSDEGRPDAVARLSSAFVKELVRLAGRQPFLVLFFDTWEQSAPFLDGWVRELLLDGFGPLQANVVVVLAGRDPQEESLHVHAAEVPLEVFTEREARELLATRGVTDEAAVTSILDTALGLPLLLDVLAGTRPPHVAAHASVGASVDSAVDRFLDRIEDTERRDAVLGCSLPLRFDEEIFRAAVPAAEPDLFPWLRAQPFVTDRDGHGRYHDVVRASMLRHQRASSPTKWIDDHTRLADTFADLRTAHEVSLSADSRWADGTWRGHRLDETYHRLCAHPAQHLTAALEEAIHAAGHDLPTLRRWADILTKAGVDSDAPAVTDWGRRLTEATAGEQGVLDGLAALLTAPDLSTAARASAHLYRGRYLHHADRPDEAIAELGRAIDIHPTTAVAYQERGEAHHWLDLSGYAVGDLLDALDLDPGLVRSYALLGAVELWRECPEDAIPAFDRALALGPDVDWIRCHRGTAHLVEGNRVAALADLNRALELDPEYEVALVVRGVLHGQAGRLDQAVADLSRAVELDPGYGWAFGRRGVMHRQAGRTAQALADLDRALELDPKDTWALVTRADLHSAEGRPEAALADLNRAVELQWWNRWALARRSSLHQQEGRPEEALADLDRAVEIAPTDDWSFAVRGSLHRQEGRLDEALADLNLAVELDPEDDWNLVERGLVHRQAGRLEEALTDLDRAVELAPESDWAVGERGLVRQMTERFDESVADFTRAVELAPENSWALAQRGESRRLAGRYEEAIADLSRAVELDPRFASAFAWRGEAHRQAGRPDEALADLNRAVELDPEDDWVLGVRGGLHRQERRSAEAIADFDRALALEPDDVWDLIERGRAYRQTGRYDDALADFDRAIELEPDHDTAVAQRGETFRLAGRLDEAVADFTRALEIHPSYDWVRQQRALAHQTAGSPDQARADLRQLLAKDDVDALVRPQYVLLDSREHGLDAHREDWRAVLDLAERDAEEYIARFAALLRPLLVDRGEDIEAPTRRFLELIVDQEGVDELTFWLSELEAIPGDHAPDVRRLRQRLRDHRARL